MPSPSQGSAPIRSRPLASCASTALAGRKPYFSTPDFSHFISPKLDADVVVRRVEQGTRVGLGHGGEVVNLLLALRAEAAALSGSHPVPVLIAGLGAGEPTIAVAAEDSLFRHAFFYPDGTLLALGNTSAGGEDRLSLRRYSRSLELGLETVLEVDGFRSIDLFEMSVTFGCDDVALIASAWSQGAPVVAVDGSRARVAGVGRGWGLDRRGV